MVLGAGEVAGALAPGLVVATALGVGFGGCELAARFSCFLQVDTLNARSNGRRADRVSIVEVKAFNSGRIKNKRFLRNRAVKHHANTTLGRERFDISGQKFLAEELLLE